MRKPGLTLALLVLLAAALGACGDGGEDRSIKIGAIFDLTGPTSDVGASYAEGVRGYVKWLNASGGIEGAPVDLVFQDYAYQVPQAEQLYSQFVSEGVVAFMGWGTGDTEALRARIADDRIPFTSASYSHVLGDPEEAPYNFLVGTSYSDQFIIVLDWIREDVAARGVRAPPRVALMHHASPFGLAPWNQGGRQYANDHGIDAKSYEMPRGATDFTAELTRLRQDGAEYVVFQNTSGPVAITLRNARSLGLDATFICLNWCSNEVLTDLAGTAAEGVVGSMPFAPLSEDVEGIQEIRSYLTDQGASIEDLELMYAQGWWTTAVMVEGIRSVTAAGQELTGENIKGALEQLRDFKTGGVTVPIVFSAEDHWGSDGMRLFRVREGVWVPMTDFRTAPDWAADQ